MRQLPWLKDKPYNERLNKPKMPTLSYRRIRGDMIEAFKIITGTLPDSLNYGSTWHKVQGHGAIQIKFPFKELPATSWSDQLHQEQQHCGKASKKKQRMPQVLTASNFVWTYCGVMRKSFMITGPKFPRDTTWRYPMKNPVQRIFKSCVGNHLHVILNIKSEWCKQHAVFRRLMQNMCSNISVPSRWRAMHFKFSFGGIAPVLV